MTCQAGFGHDSIQFAVARHHHCIVRALCPGTSNQTCCLAEASTVILVPATYFSHLADNVVCAQLQWRQKMRKPEHKLIVKEADEEVAQSEMESLPGGFRKMLQRSQKKEVDVRERTSGILLSDRTESEDQPFE